MPRGSRYFAQGAGLLLACLVGLSFSAFSMAQQWMPDPSSSTFSDQSSDPYAIQGDVYTGGTHQGNNHRRFGQAPSSVSTYTPNRFSGGGSVRDQYGNTLGTVTRNKYTGGASYQDNQGYTSSYTPSRLGGGMIQDSDGGLTRVTPNRFTGGADFTNQTGQMTGRYRPDPYNGGGTYQDNQGNSVSTTPSRFGNAFGSSNTRSQSRYDSNGPVDDYDSYGDDGNSFDSSFDSSW